MSWPKNLFFNTNLIDGKPKILPVSLPSDRPLQSGAGGLPCYEVVGQLEVRGQRESLVDLLLVTQLPQTNRLLP